MWQGQRLCIGQFGNRDDANWRTGGLVEDSKDGRVLLPQAAEGTAQAIERSTRFEIVLASAVAIIAQEPQSHWLIR